MNNNSNNKKDKTNVKPKKIMYLPYCIPKLTDENYFPNWIVKELLTLSTENEIKRRSKLIVGCELISFENKFTEILDSAYKSFLLGMDYACVALTSLAAERMCYDLIEKICEKLEGNIK